MPKSGDKISLRCWVGAPYRSKQRVLRESMISDVQRCEISGQGNVYVGGEPAPKGFAQADGFRSHCEMINWFRDQHGLPFSGVLIRWRNNSEERAPAFPLGTGAAGSRFVDPDAVLREAEAWCEGVDRIDEEDRMHEDHMALALWDGLRDVRRRWESDQAILRGALQILKEAGLAPGSSELLAAAERFDPPLKLRPAELRPRGLIRSRDKHPHSL